MKTVMMPFLKDTTSVLPMKMLQNLSAKIEIIFKEKKIDKKI